MITLEHDGRRYENATRESLLDAGVPEDVVTAAELADVRAEALAAIDAHAGVVRSRYLTLIPGQEMTYQRKTEQARAYLALDAAARAAAGHADFPLLLPEAAAVGADPAPLAALIIAREDAWLQIGGQIEAARVGGKADVSSRRLVHTIADARAAAIAALNALSPPA